MAEDSALFQEAMKRGSTHAWSGRWVQAIDEYELALEQFPEDVSARTYMAMALYKTGRLQEALNLYQSLWQAQPSNLSMLQRLAEIQEALGDRESAVASYRVLAEIHSHRRAPREAVKAWRKVVELKPDFPMFWDSLAEAAQETGTVREVMPGYLNLARQMALEGRFQEAIQITEKARSLDPGHTAVMSLLESIRRGLQYSWRAASAGEEVSSEELARLIPPVLIKVDVHINAPFGTLPQASPPREDVAPASQSASLEMLGNLLAAGAEQRGSASPPESVEDIRERVADVQKQVSVVREQVAEVHEQMAAVQEQVTAARGPAPIVPQGQEDGQEPQAIESGEEAQAIESGEEVLAIEPGEEPQTPREETVEVEEPPALEAAASGEPEEEESPVEPARLPLESETPEEMETSLVEDEAQEEVESVSFGEERPGEVETLPAMEEPQLEQAPPLADGEPTEDLDAAPTDEEAATEAADSSLQAELAEEISAPTAVQQLLEEAVPLSIEEEPVEEEPLPVEEEAALAEERPIVEEVAPVDEEAPWAEEQPAEEESLAIVEEAASIEEEIPSIEDGASLEPVEEEPLPIVEEVPTAGEQPAEEEILPIVEETPLAEEQPVDEEPPSLEDDRVPEMAEEAEAPLAAEPEAAEPGLSWDTSEDVVESEQPTLAAGELLAAAEFEISILPEASPDEASLLESVRLPEIHREEEPGARPLEDAEEALPLEDAEEALPLEDVEEAQPSVEPMIEPAMGQAEVASAPEEVAPAEEDKIRIGALSWEEMMLYAQEAKRSGRLQEAIELFEQGMAAGTFIAEHLIELAEVYQQVGQMDRAMSTYDRALELVPGHPGALIGKARHYLLIGELGLARDEVRRVLEKPANGGTELASAAVELLLEVLRDGAVGGDLEEVAEELAWLQSRYTPGMLSRPVSVALSEAPTELLGHCAGEHLQEITGLPAGVRGDLIEALRRSEEQLRSGLLRSAADEMWRVIAARPDFLPAQSLLGRVLVAQGRAEEARQKAQRLLELYRQRGRLEQSLEVLWWAVAHGLVDDEARSELMSLLRTQQRNEDAALVGLSWQVLSGGNEYGLLTAELSGEGDGEEMGLTRESAAASSGFAGNAASEPAVPAVDDLLLLAENRFALGDRSGAAGLLRDAMAARGSDGDVKAALARILSLVAGEDGGREALAEGWEGLDLPEELVN